MDCENCRHLTVVDLHDSDPRCVPNTGEALRSAVRGVPLRYLKARTLYKLTFLSNKATLLPECLHTHNLYIASMKFLPIKRKKSSPVFFVSAHSATHIRPPPPPPPPSHTHTHTHTTKERKEKGVKK